MMTTPRGTYGDQLGTGILPPDATVVFIIIL